MRVGELGSGEDSFFISIGVEEDLWEVLGYFIKVYWFRALGNRIGRFYSFLGGEGRINKIEKK